MDQSGNRFFTTGLRSITARRAMLALAAAITLLVAPATWADIDASRDLFATGLFDAHARGAGQDLLIGVYEPGACIDRDHEAFASVGFLPRLPGSSCNARSSGGDGILSHSTKVASALASRRWDRPNSGLFAGRLVDADSDARTWADLVELDPDFINMSRTIAPLNAYDIDAAVYDRRIFVANGAGNTGTSDADRARCFAYNSLCVGGYLHGGTDDGVDFRDDRHADAASWRNSPQSGREEPDLVGPFLQAVAVAGVGYELEGGTSYATPAVVGLAALLTADYPETLRREPTLMRALLMASASHRVVDPETPWFGAPVIADDVDDRSGAGVPRGDRAQAIVEGGRTFAKKIRHDTDVASDGRLHDAITLSVPEDAIVRVALTWDQCPVRFSEDQDRLTVDLDLKVRGPGITLLEFETEITQAIREPDEASVPNPFIALGDPAGSTWQERLTHREVLVANPSRVDNYELVEFRAPVGGEYRIEMESVRWDVCEHDGLRETHVALAWDLQGGVQPYRYQLTSDTTSTFDSDMGTAPLWSPDFGANQGYRVGVHPRHLADVNGDGHDDVVAFANDGVYVALGDGYGFGASRRWTSLFAILFEEDDATYPRHLADVNGDGMADIVHFSQFGTWVSLSTGSEFAFWRRWSESFGTSEGYSTTEHIRLIEDMNGDGRGDVVAFANRGVYVALSNGSSFGPVERWVANFGRDAGSWSVSDHLRLVADVNADGFPDIVGFGDRGVWISISMGHGFQSPTLWIEEFGTSAGGWHPSRHPRFMEDVTGDGFPDIVGIGEHGVWVSVGTGGDFLPPSLWLSGFGARAGWTVGSHPRFVRDVDGDGRADVVGIANDGVYLAKSIGHDFGTYENVIESFGSHAGWYASTHPRLLADPDGDGVPEVVGFHDDGTRVGELLPEEAVVVPEPALLPGVLAGLIALAGAARRRPHR